MCTQTAHFVPIFGTQVQTFFKVCHEGANHVWKQYHGYTQKIEISWDTFCTFNDTISMFKKKLCCFEKKIFFQTNITFFGHRECIIKDAQSVLLYLKFFNIIMVLSPNMISTLAAHFEKSLYLWPN